MPEVLGFLFCQRSVPQPHSRVFFHLCLPSRSSVSGLKQTLLAESGALTSYSHRVFSAWDFGLCGAVHVRLRQRIILYELQVELEEAAVRRRAAGRTLGQQAQVWLVRALLNLLVLALLGAAFYGVYWITEESGKPQNTQIQQAPLLQLVVSYLPSIFISAVNFVLPPVFNLIGPLEGYTRSHQIVLILLRFQPEGHADGAAARSRLNLRLRRKEPSADGVPGRPGFAICETRRPRAPPQSRTDTCGR